METEETERLGGVFAAVTGDKRRQMHLKDARVREAKDSEEKCKWECDGRLLSSTYLYSSVCI